MTPAARVQAAIDILDLVVASARANGAPADRIVADWFRPRRFAGSGDRRAVRDLVFGAIRACGPVPDSGRAAMLRLAEGDAGLAALFDGSRHAPPPVTPDEEPAAGGVAPAWLVERLAASGIDGAAAEALLGRAPLDVRVNALRAASAPVPEGGQALAGGGLRYPHGTRIEDSEAFRAGTIEVQDLGSQLACSVVAARAGETVLDLCAGAGGKTLALAAQMGEGGDGSAAGGGRLVASDTDRARLSRLGPRAERAGARFIEQRLLDPGRELAALADLVNACDAVLIDAPCSGTGTWRRNPEARWRLTPAQVERYAATQARLLDLATGLVRPGGRLVFVTCSLLDEEGAGEIPGFLARNPGFAARRTALPLGTPRGEGIRLDPARDGTDGFFVACLERL